MKDNFITKCANKITIALRNKKVAIAVSGVISALIFVIIYGVGVLSPVYTEWMLAGGDLSQHYLGWELYKNAAWQPQIGMMDTIAYPYNESVIFTDSIPLAAVLGKIVYGLCHVNFQYFGLWSFVCMILMGILASIIICKYTDDGIVIVLTGMVYTLSPVMLRRIFWHTSLASHFIILLTILIIVYRNQYFKHPAKAALCWGIVGMLCSFIHIYFIGMTFIMFVSYALMTAVDMYYYIKMTKTVNKDVHDDKKLYLYRIALSFLAYISAAVISIWWLGGLSSGMDDGAPGLGYYSFNLNGFFNPQDWSSVIPNMNNYADGQYEGFAYLGLGTLILVYIGLFTGLVEYTVRALAKNISCIKQKIAYLLVWIVTVLMSVIAAASNEIAYGKHLIVNVRLPHAISELWAVFRASGRLVWPAVYIIMLSGIVFLIKSNRRKFVIIVMSLCVLVQIYDLKDKIMEKHEEFTRTDVVYEHRINDEYISNMVAENGIKHIVFVDKDNLSQEQLYAFAEFAARHELTINDFYFARNLMHPIADTAFNDFVEPKSDTLYVAKDDMFTDIIKAKFTYYIYEDMYVGVIR